MSVRREEAAEQVREWGGDRVVLHGDNLYKDIEEALDGRNSASSSIRWVEHRWAS